MKKRRLGLGILGFSAISLSLGLVANCGNDSLPGANGANGGGASGTIILDPNAPISGSGGSVSTTAAPTATANCGKSASGLSRKAADLIIVLDRSSSMTWDIARSNSVCNPTSATCTQRWATTTSALNSVLSSNVAANINWGLKLYGSDGECGVSNTMEVPIAASNANAVKQAIASATPGSRTPTRLGVQAATNYLKTVNDGHAKSILLATDGEPNCATSTGGGRGGGGAGSADVQGTITAIAAAAAAGFPVYVIGIGPEVGNLDNFAKAGGTDHYYAATTPEALATALASIVGQVASCTYSLGKLPPDPNNIGVYLDKKLIPKDGANGWTLAAGNQTVVFNGSYCEGIKNETYKQVEILFGCPGEAIPVTIP